MPLLKRRLIQRWIGKKAEGIIIGIITALEKEYEAIEALLINTILKDVPGEGAGRRYLIGEIPIKGGNNRSVVVMLLPGMGNNLAASGATLLLENFPNVRWVIIAGIAGGIPYPNQPDEHVRLGDIVVSNQYGVIQYDYGKETPTEFIFRHSPRPPAAKLLEAARMLEVGELRGERPWLQFIDLALQSLGQTRPPETTDILTNPMDPPKIIAHPEDPKRQKNQPRVFLGTIASANLLLKNPYKRDALREKFGVKAVEMESSGIADATWIREAGYLVIRGVSDYCDSSKNDTWHFYAAIAAAAYTRALLESISFQPIRERRLRSWGTIILLALFAAITILWSRLTDQSPKYQVYIESKMLPIEVYCDGHFWRTLDDGAPFTTIALEEGEHLILAKWGEFQRETRITLTGENYKRMIIIPRLSKSD